jgi:integrase
VPAKRFPRLDLLPLARYEDGWKNAKHRQQWTNTLTTYAYPIIGDTLVEDVDTAAVRRVLTPIWTAKPETASRLRGRIEAVLTYAQAAGWRKGDNPARLEGPLGILLGPHGDKAKIVHHAALPWQEIAAFMTALEGRDAVASRALKLLILTAVRTSEALNATWAEIDTNKAIWTIPASRMKGGREHQVPLPPPATLSVLRQVGELRATTDPGQPVFLVRSRASR